MAEFKVGDTVRALENSSDICSGKIYTINRASTPTTCFFKDDVGYQRQRVASNYELITSQENNNMDTLHKIENLELDADTQLLRKYGIEDNTGTLTATGKDALLRVLYLANKAAVVAKLKAVEAAEADTATDADAE